MFGVGVYLGDNSNTAVPAIDTPTTNMFHPYFFNADSPIHHHHHHDIYSYDAPADSHTHYETNDDDNPDDEECTCNDYD